MGVLGEIFLSRQSTSLVIAENLPSFIKEKNVEVKSEFKNEMKVSFMPQDQLENMLAERYGSELKPRKKYEKRKEPGTVQKPKTKQAEKKKVVRPAIHSGILAPRDLTADDLKNLHAAGKTKQEVMQMYNFKNLTYFNTKIKDLGCRELYRGKHGRPKKAV